MLVFENVIDLNMINNDSDIYVAVVPTGFCYDESIDCEVMQNTQCIISDSIVNDYYFVETDKPNYIRPIVVTKNIILKHNITSLMELIKTITENNYLTYYVAQPLFYKKI